MKKNGCFSYLFVVIISCILSLLVVSFIDNQPVADLNSDPIDIIDKDDFPVDDTVTLDDSSSGDTLDDSCAPSDVLPDNFSGVSANTISTYYYDQLNREEKNIYDVLLAGLKKGENKFVFNNVNCNEYSLYCTRVVYAINYEHPELFWMICGYQFVTSRMPFSDIGSFEVEVLFYSYWNYSLNKEDKIEELNNAVDYVASLASKKSTDFERILFVHDYLIENAIYDHDGLAEYRKTIHDSSCEYIFSAYGCLVNRKTVCSGYAKAFQLITQKMGYSCIYVVGDAGESHAWNCIFLEDEGYYIDVTWDDADYDYEESLHDYFCITSEELSITHTPEDFFVSPICTAEKYNYFVYLDYIIEDYSFDEFCSIVERQMDCRIATVKFETQEELEQAYSDLFVENNVFDIPYLKPGKFAFAKDDARLSIVLYLNVE